MNQIHFRSGLIHIRAIKIGLIAAGALAMAACTKSSTQSANPAAQDTASSAEQSGEPAAAAVVPEKASGDKAGDKAHATGAKVAALGEQAPDFRLMDLDGQPVSLADYRGKTVVLEWFNPGCPFIKYAHGEGPLKDMGSIPGAGDDEVVWLAINSGAPGKQGHGVELNRQARSDWQISFPILTDEDGQVGRMYEAKTTPHMYVIDKDGTLVYRGALDNAPLGRVKGNDGQLVSYVDTALGDLAGGVAVATAETKPYGCTVKY